MNSVRFLQHSGTTLVRSSEIGRGCSASRYVEVKRLVRPLAGSLRTSIFKAKRYKTKKERFEGVSLFASSGRCFLDVDDEINARCGQQKIRLATQAPGRVWRMNQERLSPRYTTNLNEIMTVNCL